MFHSDACSDSEQMVFSYTCALGWGIIGYFLLVRFPGLAVQRKSRRRVCSVNMPQKRTFPLRSHKPAPCTRFYLLHPISQAQRASHIAGTSIFNEGVHPRQNLTSILGDRVGLKALHEYAPVDWNIMRHPFSNRYLSSDILNGPGTRFCKYSAPNHRERK